MYTCQDVIRVLEDLADPGGAEDWDNVGLVIGSKDARVSRVLVTLDVTPEVIGEAVGRGAGLIVSHHPPFLEPVRNIDFASPSGRLIKEVIRSGLGIYTLHTNLDVAMGGVNYALAQALGLRELSPLTPVAGEALYKLVVFVPVTHEKQVRLALGAAGAGHIGNYSHCTFRTSGVGTFLPLEGASPFIGTPGELEEVEEVRVETIVPKRRLNGVLEAMLEAHPYEEVAYDVYPLANRTKAAGLIGVAPRPGYLHEFAEWVKERLSVAGVRVAGRPDTRIEKVAVCGGAGGNLIRAAYSAGADVLVTGEVRYHQALEAVHLGMAVVEGGHYGTERAIIPVLANYLKQKLPDLAVEVSEVNTDPWQWA